MANTNVKIQIFDLNHWVTSYKSIQTIKVAV